MTAGGELPRALDEAARLGEDPVMVAAARAAWAANSGAERLYPAELATLLQAALRAAYPYIAARVLAEAADEMQADHPETAKRLDAINAVMREAHPQWLTSRAGHDHAPGFAR